MSTPRRILTIEDNPITRKLFRLILSQEGYSVSEAEDGATAIALVSREEFDLILQDLLLPDIDGLVLVRRLRGLRNGASIPIIACTGFLSRIELGQVTTSGFSDLLAKPVDTTRLVNAVREHLPRAEASTSRPGKERRVLVVDDDPVQLKLTRILLDRLGFEVSTAQDGVEALAEARRSPPDAILSDVMMPRMDGFQLAAEVRRDPRLSVLPVILVSSSYVDPDDRELARQSGANALLVRTPDPRETCESLLKAMEGQLPASAPAAEADRIAIHHDRVPRQLERQIETLAVAGQRSSTHAAMLSVVAGISEALAHRFHLDDSMDDVLASVLDACGVSKGALYLAAEAGDLELRSQAGFGDGSAAAPGSFWGCPELLARVLQDAVPIAVPSAAVPSAMRDAFLPALRSASALLVPFVSGGESFGLLLLTSSKRNLAEPEWLPFARTIAVQLGQALALARSVSSLAASEERFRQITEAIHEVFWMVDARTRKSLYVSPACKEVWGRTQEEMMSSPWAWTEGIVPEDRERVLAAVRSTPPAENIALDFRVARPDGSIRWIRSRGFPIRDAKGEVYRIAGIAEDVTELKAFEDALRVSEAELHQAQKMEAVGRLAGGVAHDFNNLLTAMMGFAELLRRKLDPRDPLHGHVEEILKAGQRAASLTRQLLAFSRKQVLQPRAIDLNAVLRDLERMIGRLIGEDIEVRTKLAPGLGTVMADPGQLEQVVLNLTVNARDAMPRGGVLTLETSIVTLRAGQLRNGGEEASGTYVLLSVGDTGTGMTPEVKARIFEPFFTTKEEGKGTGLGLATVYGIVRQSGGHVSVVSEVGRGSTFHIYLPRVDAAVEPERPDSPVARRRATETVLVVEDEEMVRMLVRDALRMEGYEVLDASNGGEALLLCERSRAPIHLILSDLIMPRVSGRDLVDRLRPLQPEMRVLFMSGYSEAAAMAQGDLALGAPLLQKPFTLEALLSTVRSVLDAS